MELYQAVERLQKLLPDIKSKEDKEALLKVLQSSEKYMRIPVKVWDGSEVLIASNKCSNVSTYLEIFQRYDFIDSVYLFGSALTDECREKSDLDLLVVTDCTREEWRSMRNVIWETNPDTDTDDLLRLSTEDLNRIYAGDRGFGVEELAIRKGVKIYERQLV